MQSRFPSSRQRRLLWPMASLCVLIALCGLMANSSWSQSPAARKSLKKNPRALPPLPDDKRLLSLHLDFVKKAQKLAQEYEQKKDWEKAKVVYGEILKLTPQYQPALDRLQQLQARESTAERATMTVAATKPWQDTGIRVIKGKPVTIRAQGNWTFTLTAELGPEGMKIPKELQKHNLGCLMGLIQPAEASRSSRGKDNQPVAFSIGRELSFVAKESGALFVCMYDKDHQDNRGNVKLEIEGTFERGR